MQAAARIIIPLSMLLHPPVSGPVDRLDPLPCRQLVPQAVSPVTDRAFSSHILRAVGPDPVDQRLPLYDPAPRSPPGSGAASAHFYLVPAEFPPPDTSIRSKRNRICRIPTGPPSGFPSPFSRLSLRIDPGPQHSQAEGLGDVVVGSRLQPRHDVCLHIVGCKKDDWNRPFPLISPGNQTRFRPAGSRPGSQDPAAPP